MEIIWFLLALIGVLVFASLVILRSLKRTVSTDIGVNVAYEEEWGDEPFGAYREKYRPAWHGLDFTDQFPPRRWQ